ncbi:MAG: FliI/YscN family ATPase [Pseudomonadota bacterium]
MGLELGFENLTQNLIQNTATKRLWGSIVAIDGGVLRISGLNAFARISDEILLDGYEDSVGEVIAIDDEHIIAMPSISLTGVAAGARVYLSKVDAPRPCKAWLGRVLDHNGRSVDHAPAPRGDCEAPLLRSALPAGERRGLGPRIDTGHAALDTFLPMARGQRIGLFAGSGVGKSRLIASLAQSLNADVVVVALIGERSREVREFVEETLGPEGRARSVVVAATCDEAATAKRRAAYLAMATAEYFRDQGLHVLLLFDSITRFADAHREIALTAGETPSLRAFPPSTTRTISALAERAGPGAGAGGDITAIFSVLVAGSDMDEPIADMVRGILDGHIVLERTIAERGRFPAIDVRRSVSRALPKAASEEELRLLGEGRSLLAAYDDAVTMIQTGLYTRGADPVIDRAADIWPALDAFIGSKSPNCTQSFERLAKIISGEDAPET